MEYTVFKLRLQEILQKKAEEGAVVEVRNIPKNNGICREGLLIREPDSSITPTIYLEQIYDAWCREPVPLGELADRILEIYRRERKTLPEDVSFFTDFFKARRHIYLRLVHLEKNRRQLEQMPHRKILDLAIVCYYRMEGGELGDATISVMEEHRKLWKISEERLFAVARANTLRDQKICFLDMDQMIREFAGDRDVPESIFPREDVVPMYVLTNRDKIFGAFCIFYPHVQQHISDYLNASYYVLPSSIHEVILVPDSGQISGFELQNMVAEINRSQVDPMEILSDNIYYYDREKGTLVLFEE
ncbi:MAG TPA: hypothetical protein DF613_12330 [Lachnospiraceae bacterium]|nr:hypothetical protein [Lachnospiraceae bacterium]